MGLLGCQFRFTEGRCDLGQALNGGRSGHLVVVDLRSADGQVLCCRTTGAPRFGIGADVDLCHSGERTVAFPKRPNE